MPTVMYMVVILNIIFSPRITRLIVHGKPKHISIIYVFEPIALQMAIDAIPEVVIDRYNKMEQHFMNI